MTTVAIRKKLVDYIKVTDYKKIKALYILLEADIEHGKRISIEQYNIELAEAEAEYEKGDYITHEEAIKQMKKW